MNRKKGAIELSVTAIVILILAIVMLGLGLGFVRGMFGKVSTQVEQQISAEPEPHVPTGANPITLSRESIITHAGEKEVMKVSTFNPTNESWPEKKPAINCGGLTGISGSANKRTINQGEFATFDLLITIPSSGPDTYLCQITMEDYQKDMTIKIIQ